MCQIDAMMSPLFSVHHKEKNSQVSYSKRNSAGCHVRSDVELPHKFGYVRRVFVYDCEGKVAGRRHLLKHRRMRIKQLKQKCGNSHLSRFQICA